MGIRVLSTELKKTVVVPSLTKAEIPPELQVMAGYMEYIDTMLAKTTKMERQMANLEETYAKKRALRSEVKWTDASEIDKLFVVAQEQKRDMAAEIAGLKQMLLDARQVFAVDAPDGDSDGHVNEELFQVNRIIEEASQHEDKDAVIKQHMATERILKEQGKVFAVDAPDGDSDGHVQEEMHEVNRIIEEASQSEDKQAIIMQHKVQEKIQMERAKDAEHDW